MTQSLNLTATLQNDASVKWTASGSNCSGAACGTFSNVTPTSASYIAPAGAGIYSITATSVADSSKSASATIAVTGLTGVTTHHNDLSRAGANTQEFALTPSNVNTTTFGKLFSCAVDGAIYAQPLWVANVSINNIKHNVVLVATQHDGVYAFDADASPCVTLWHANLVDSAHGGTPSETSVPSTGAGFLVGNGDGDIWLEVGITGTPVIDLATNTLYVVTKSVVLPSLPIFQRLHGLDLSTGNEKLNGNKPMLITASVPGDGDGSSGGIVSFDAQNQNQRAGLALVNGVVYVAWASHDDHDPYHGWLIGYNASTLTQATVFNTTPNAVGTASYSRGGIWMSGGAPAADANSNLYLITGNGTYDGVTSFSDSILKLSTSGGLAVQDWFTPSDQSFLDSNDFDLGSGGAVILVDQNTGPVKHLLIGGGKHGSGSDGQIYVLNRDSLGQFSSIDNGVVQKLPLNNMIFGTPAFWQNNLYIAGVGGPLVAFSLNSSIGQFNSSFSSRSTTVYNFPGATPSVSSNGANSGIVWAVDSSNFGPPRTSPAPAVLHAYDATNLANELWNSSQAAANRDQAGNAVKFTVPTIANGKVYIGTRTELDVYGLKPN